MSTIVVPVSKVQDNFSIALKEIESGNSVIITKYGKKVGTLKPYHDKKRTNGKKISQSIKTIAVQCGSGIVNTADYIRKDRESNDVVCP